MAGSNTSSAKSSNDFSSEITGQILMKLGHNDHLLVRIIIKIRGLAVVVVVGVVQYTKLPHTNQYGGGRGH